MTPKRYVKTQLPAITDIASRVGLDTSLLYESVVELAAEGLLTATAVNAAAAILLTDLGLPGYFFRHISKDALKRALHFIGTTDQIYDFLTVEVSPSTLALINSAFLVLGVAGLVTAYGLLRDSRWGYWGALIVNIATIVFDVWGFTVQSSAALGFVMPVISIILLYRARDQFTSGEER